MKNKPLSIVIFVIIVIIAGISLILINNNKEKTKEEIVEISYTYGGGFGTIIDTANKTITISQNGEVVLSNSYNSYKETLNIEQSKYNELSDYISDRITLFDEKANENSSVLDGSSSKISIKLKNDEVKVIGGYMIQNKKFNEIEKKIFEVIDKEALNQYEKNIETNN